MWSDDPAAGTPPLRGAGGELEARWLFDGPVLRIGSWKCRSRGESRGDGRSLGWYQIAFLDRGVFMLHSRGKTEIVDQSGALIHSPLFEFRTSHPFGCGDAGTFFALPSEAFADLAGRNGISSRKFSAEPFHVSHSVVTSRAYLRVRLLVARLSRKESADALEVEESSTFLLERILSDAATRVGNAKPRAAARARRQRIVEDAKERLASNYRRPSRLGAFAGEMGVSPFHLCRLFREETGISMHRYVNRLRLRSALRGAIAGADLGQLALESGFSSHSHFTAAFRREFGAAPRVIRGIFEDRLSARILLGSRIW